MARSAYVLPEGAVAGTGPVNFPGFPGIWTPGQPIAALELLRHTAFADEDELAAAVEELGLPLEQVDVANDEGAMPFPPNHIVGRDEAIADALEARPRARSHKQLDKAARDAGITFSSEELTAAQKQAELDAHLAAQAAEPDNEPEPPAEGEES